MRRLVVCLLALIAACSPAAGTPTSNPTATSALPASNTPTTISTSRPTQAALPAITPTVAPTQTAPASATQVLPTLTRSSTATRAATGTSAPAATTTRAATPAGSNATPGAAFRLQLEPVTAGLVRPVYVGHAGDARGRLFIIEKPGRIRIMRNGVVDAQPFLDITALVGSRGNEQGLLGLAFDPQYRSNGQFFVNYTDVNGDTVIARYQVSSNPDRADPNSASIVLTQDQPFANHNGGDLVFGPDGYLYIGLGDGGSQGDPNRNGQNPNTWLGKMLRIDVHSAQPYGIPRDNPFVNRAGYRPEIWALGLRNPWRYSFDSATGDLYIGDVGQNAYEEIDFQPANSKGGENYGWNAMEGKHCYRAETCEQSKFVLPVAEFSHSIGGCAVTSGFVYRGKQFPTLVGKYIFTDYCAGILWTLERDAGGKWVMTQRGQTDASISSFGVDESGEIYATDDPGGRILRLTVASGT